MRIAGKYVGHGLGPPPDVDDKYPRWKEDLRRKFKATAAPLLEGDTSKVYTVGLAEAVAKIQTNWGFPATGIIDAKFQYKMKWAVPPPRVTGPRGTLYTCQGTKPSDMWWGPQADVARAVEDLYYWQPIDGPYQAFPMNNSINAEKATLRYEIERHGQLVPNDPISAFGFSQGAIVISEVFMEMRNPSDPLHYRFKDWYRAATTGSPSRQTGVNNGNKWARWASGYPDLGPNKRGIMEDSRRMVDTPDWWLDFCHLKDLYCDCETDDEGEFKTSICKVIMGNWFGGPDSIVSQALEIVTRPMMETFSMVKALIDAGLFFGGGIKPHLSYDVRPAIAYLRS